MKYFKRADYKRLKQFVEDMVEEYTVVLVEDMLEEIKMLGYGDATVFHLAYLVRYSDKVTKLYEKKKCPGEPAGHFVWLVDTKVWENISTKFRRNKKCVL